MAELKPCPFCGGKAFSYYIKPHKHFLVNTPEHNGSGYVECTKCSCVLCADTEQEAIKMWDTRTPQKKNKCGTCMYSKPTTLGKSKCWVECTNQEHIKRFCKNELARKRQATNPACDCYKEKSEPQKIEHNSLCETETYKVGGAE